MSTATSDYGPPYSTTSPFDRLGAALARNWWLIGLRGLLGLVFGVIALIMPIATILALVLLFSAYMLVDGVFAIFAAVRAAQQREHWGLLVLQGIASIADEEPLVATYPGAQFVVRVQVTEVYGNCPRYIHKYQRVQPSEYVPRTGSEPPIPAWKLRDDMNPILPAHDPARKSV